MNMPFAERLRADRRLVILRLLAEQISYKANSSVLTMALDHFGHVMSRDQVKTELHWLAEQDLVEIHELAPTGILSARLTARGLEVSRGSAIVPGVARPGA